MCRTRVMLSALCLALTAPVLANEPAGVLESRPQSAEVRAAASGTATGPRECSVPEVTVPYTEEYFWRWTAYRELDCAIEAIERAMKSADSEEGTVTLTREELEHLRARAFWAKDAAARIGR
jgi:hypothetical protein